MTAIKSHNCFKCNTELTTPSPIVEWAPGCSVNGGMTVEFRGGVGSQFEGHIFVGVVCDVCAQQLATMAGQLTAHYPRPGDMPAGTNMIDSRAAEEPAP